MTGETKGLLATPEPEEPSARRNCEPIAGGKTTPWALGLHASCRPDASSRQALRTGSEAECWIACIESAVLACASRRSCGVSGCEPSNSRARAEGFAAVSAAAVAFVRSASAMTARSRPVAACSAWSCWPRLVATLPFVTESASAARTSDTTRAMSAAGRITLHSARKGLFLSPPGQPRRGLAIARGVPVAPRARPTGLLVGGFWRAPAAVPGRARASGHPRAHRLRLPERAPEGSSKPERGLEPLTPCLQDRRSAS